LATLDYSIGEKTTTNGQDFFLFLIDTENYWSSQIMHNYEKLSQADGFFFENPTEHEDCN
jgi:hypothetical protein